MTEKEPNPLDPALGLTYTVNHVDGEDVHTYHLTIAVQGECLDVDSLQLITDPEMIADAAKTAGFTIVENEVNDVVTLRVLAGQCDDPNTIALEITNNEDGSPGNIVVLISPPPTSVYSHSPQGDGKSIIRFEKARLQPSPLVK